MLLFAEIFLFAVGLFLAATGKAGAWVAGKGFAAEGGKVRLTGVILALPLPLAFCAGLVIGIIDSNLVGIVGFFEIAMVIGSAVIAIIMLRNARKPVDAPVTTPTNVEPK